MDGRNFWIRHGEGIEDLRTQGRDRLQQRGQELHQMGRGDRPDPAAAEIREHPDVGDPEGNVARWHKTDSVDYAICRSGEMVMELEDGEVLLKPGDVVIQRGTLHNWKNRGPEPCIMAFILIATVGAKTTAWNESH